MTSPIRVETGSDPALAVVTIDHPPLNLYDRDLHTALVEAVTQLETGKPRGALFRAEGKVVSGGVDVRDSFLPISQDADVEAGTRYFAELVELGERVHRLPFPTVFAAHGLTLTWAFELALACDLIVAAESASFGLIEATVGLTPAMGGTQRLAQRVGQGRAKYFVMTAGRFGATEMERWGAVDRLVPDGELDATARTLAQDLAAGPTTAHAATKEILATLAADGLDTANARTAEIAGKLFATADLRGAMDSFVERGHGKATFRGA
ncbi:enoyl-CoA hydratase/isomerase family protein [Actinomycetospora termitidis]|uniref:Enoyl-CoA hydratase/isomerase family protein n=1 Tax=Actinomycetospora termitidis TaxID=3053470 RepID=A0ABT7MFP7_9PSEU|nr:enoyl-CoA hydratase/isomerase family protein [Actinomycetospora sp. Odt1-22]MDL5159502.1 enoyl-CoA hydratase/isomerase family protein [Actinomycetospora sp. Odt1-22]